MTVEMLPLQMAMAMAMVAAMAMTTDSMVSQMVALHFLFKVSSVDPSTPQIFWWRKFRECVVQMYIPVPEMGGVAGDKLGQRAWMKPASRPHAEGISPLRFG